MQLKQHHAEVVIASKTQIQIKGGEILRVCIVSTIQENATKSMTLKQFYHYLK